MVHDLQTHALPDSPDELTRCAIRLGYSSSDREKAMATYLKDHQAPTEVANGLFKEFLGKSDRLSGVPEKPRQEMADEDRAPRRKRLL